MTSLFTNIPNQTAVINLKPAKNVKSMYRSVPSVWGSISFNSFKQICISQQSFEAPVKVKTFLAWNWKDSGNDQHQQDGNDCKNNHRQHKQCPLKDNAHPSQLGRLGHLKIYICTSSDFIRTNLRFVFALATNVEVAIAAVVKTPILAASPRLPLPVVTLLTDCAFPRTILQSPRRGPRLRSNCQDKGVVSAAKL